MWMLALWALVIWPVFVVWHVEHKQLSAQTAGDLLLYMGTLMGGPLGIHLLDTYHRNRKDENNVP